jgi:ABC-2 type transport system permease protein
MGFALVQLVILLASVGFILRPDAATLALAAGFALLVSWPVSVICLMNDLVAPKLKWTNPQQAMKGNFNALIAGLVAVLYLGVFYFGVRALYPKVLTGWGLYAAVGIALAVTGGLLHRGMESLALSKYKSIEL